MATFNFRQPINPNDILRMMSGINMSGLRPTLPTINKQAFNGVLSDTSEYNPNSPMFPQGLMSSNQNMGGLFGGGSNLLSNPYLNLGLSLIPDPQRKTGLAQRLGDAMTRMTAAEKMKQDQMLNQFNLYASLAKLSKGSGSPITGEVGGKPVYGQMTGTGTFEPIRTASGELIQPTGTKQKLEDQAFIQAVKELPITDRMNPKAMRQVLSLAIGRGSDLFNQIENFQKLSFEQDKRQPMTLFDANTGRNTTVYVNPQTGEIFNFLEGQEQYQPERNMQLVDVGDKFIQVDKNDFNKAKVLLKGKTFAEEMQSLKYSYDKMQDAMKKGELGEAAKKQIAGINSTEIEANNYRKLVQEFYGAEFDENGNVTGYDNVKANVNFFDTKLRAKLQSAHKNLLLLAKEAYNLGVLNGPDLAVMEEVIADPTSLTTKAKGGRKLLENQLDVLGGGLTRMKQGVLKGADANKLFQNDPKFQAMREIIKRKEENLKI